MNSSIAKQSKMPPHPCRKKISRFLFAAAVGIATSFLANAEEGPPALPGRDTETILSTYRVTPGQEQAFLVAVNRTWEIYRRLDAVLPRPHVLAKKVDDAGHTTYVELFTWRSSDIPDNAPAEIKAAWKKLESLCKQADGKSGIAGEEVTVAAMD
jgi:hypothetical protein